MRPRIRVLSNSWGTVLLHDEQRRQAAQVRYQVAVAAWGRRRRAMLWISAACFCASATIIAVLFFLNR